VTDETLVVCDAGPLLVLAKLNVLHLLAGLYGRVHLARSVYEEIVTEGMRRGHEDAWTLSLFLDQMGWEPEVPGEAALPSALASAHLDRGERDTLHLAVVLGSRLVLVDESEGRRTARAMGLAVRGSLGILVEAYRRGMIGKEQLRLYFAELSRRQDIWIDPALVERLRREVLGG